MIGVGAGVSRPSLRTVQAVFPHTALQSKVICYDEITWLCPDGRGAPPRDRIDPRRRIAGSATCD